jgi:hypothetical protein
MVTSPDQRTITMGPVMARGAWGSGSGGGVVLGGYEFGHTQLQQQPQRSQAAKMASIVSSNRDAAFHGDSVNTDADDGEGTDESMWGTQEIEAMQPPPLSAHDAARLQSMIARGEYVPVGPGSIRFE